jgi:hypothetical protein
MRWCLSLAVLALSSSSARADDDEPTVKGRPVDKGTLGVGIILGEPTGVCAKLYLRDDRALQAAVGSAFIGGGLQVHLDYLFHPWILQDKESFVLPVYLGPGVRVFEHTNGSDHNLALGLRGVIGMLFDFKSVPLDAFLEVAVSPEYEFGGKGVGITLNAGAGVRYYF